MISNPHLLQGKKLHLILNIRFLIKESKVDLPRIKNISLLPFRGIFKEGQFQPEVFDNFRKG